MKIKLFKILGVALTVVLMASLTVGLATVPAGAASSNLKFVKLELPQVGADGDYWVLYDSDVGPIAQTPDGGILFAAVVEGTAWNLLKSTDGYSWTATGFYDYVSGLTTPDTTAIVDVAASPEYSDDTTVVVATKDYVYISEDGGKTFTQLSAAWTPVTYDINDMDITVASDGDLSLMVATTEPEVYVTSGLLAWTDQDISGSFPAADDALACAFLPTFADDGDIGISAIITDNYTPTDVTSEDVGDTDGTGALSGTLAHFPVEAGSVTMSDTANTYTDNGSGTLTGDPVGTGTITYSTGAFTITGGALSSPVTADYTWYDSVTAVTTTTMTFSFADISAGGEWGDAIMNAPFVNADMAPFDSEWASIAFPDDFDAFGTGTNVCFAGIVQTGDLGATTLPVDSGSDAYRVILKEAGSSTAVDLDVRGVLTTLAPTGTAVTSLDVCGNAEEATILVGTDALNLADAPEYFNVYYSEDSGDSWTASAKCPTGGTGTGATFASVMTQVLMGPDFCSDGVAYAGTMGTLTSAFQKTSDAAKSWNQISIVDYGQHDEYWITNYGFSAFGYIANDTLWMITSEDPITPGSWDVDNGALWGRLDGNHWERLLSYATPGVTDDLYQLGILGDGSAMFATDLNAGEIWRSTDMGATWPKKINTKDGLMWVAPVSTTTIYTTHAAAAADGSALWWSERSGTGWEKPDDSEIPSSAIAWSASVAGDLVYGGLSTGDVFISSDGGETVEIVGSDGPFDPGSVVLVTTDLGFAANGIMYATAPMQDEVQRTIVDLDDPGDAEWEQIDDNQDATGDIEYSELNFTAGSPAIALPPSGILYVVDMSMVNDDFSDTAFNAGGLWRSTNPTADTDSVMPPYFERENKGLDEDVIIGLRSLDLNPANNLAPTFFFAAGGGDPALEYYEQIWMYTDILNIGATLVTPEADAVGVGLLPENMMGDVYPVVTFGWAEMAGATMYQLQVAIDPDFNTTVINLYTDDLGKVIDTPLLANSTYYWRVRVADYDDNFVGEPLISPWSATYKFKTVIGPSMQRPALQAPLAGEAGVPLSPTFEWSGIEWAEVYEFELATDPTTSAGGYFSSPLVSLVGSSALVSTAWKADTTLDYSMRYYWHVKAIGVDTETPWSDVGTFTTMAKPAEPTTAPPAVTVPPQQVITPAWIWAVVIIGAILVIAVIVLIVTTRRVP